jgi:hypothetical protein
MEVAAIQKDDGRHLAGKVAEGKGRKPPMFMRT